MRHEEVLMRASHQSPQAVDFSGEWTNDRASTMDIIQEGGVITGVYTSQTGGGNRATIGQLSGYGHGDLISFTVKWDSMAITAWVGRRRAEAGEDVIETLWQMTTMGDDIDQSSSHAVYVGADRFTRPARRAEGRIFEELAAGEAAQLPDAIA